MKTTIELPDKLLRRAKVIAAQRGTSLKRLVIEGLEWVSLQSQASQSENPSTDISQFTQKDAEGVSVLKHSNKKRSTLKDSTIDQMREELGI